MGVTFAEYLHMAAHLGGWLSVVLALVKRSRGTIPIIGHGIQGQKSLGDCRNDAPYFQLYKPPPKGEIKSGYVNEW
jgi:hypothetical protein